MRILTTELKKCWTGGNMAYPIELPVNFFVQKGIDEGNPLTLMKLIKILYVANGWGLAIRREQLFLEPCEAWKYGPIIPEVYRALKHYRQNPIRSRFASLNDSIQLSDFTVNLLETVWEHYGNFTDVQLSTMTHASGTPWHIVYYEKEHGGGPFAQIPDNLIREHYLPIVESVNLLIGFKKENKVNEPRFE